ncbi:hypothetical protein [Kitasatospora sp. NPDC088548]|uniref:hypothetical protein n=1 Tax=Kitasatospora sp. NPDC088548 TaxID=3364075 RepID=UPI003804C4B5
MAKALDASREGINKWESGANEPRGHRRQAYRHLLVGLAGMYGAKGDTRWLNHGQATGPTTEDSNRKGE